MRGWWRKLVKWFNPGVCAGGGVMKKYYRVGAKFKLSAGAIENYGDRYADKVFNVRAVYTHYCPVDQMENDPAGHPGFDSHGGSPLYGSELPFDLYAWEMVEV